MRTTTKVPRLLHFALFPLLLSACETPAPSSPETLAIDSAGVRIVTFDANLRETHEVWRLADQPDLSLDGRDDEGPLQFFRVTDALPLSGDRIAVANAGTGEIRIFDSTGQHLRTMGRSGQGPGEFRALAWLESLPPDTLVAGDVRLRRITLFDGEGRSSRTTNTFETGQDSASGSFGPPEPLGVFGDGSVLTVSYAAFEQKPGAVRVPATLFRYTPSGERRNPLGSWSGNELTLFEDEGRLSVAVSVFARSTRFAAAEDGFWVADDDRWELREYAPDGQLLTIVRREGGEIPVTEALRDRFVRARYATVPPGPELEEMVADQHTISEHGTTPAFGDFKLGTDGRIWISDYALPDDAVISWTVLEADGRPTASVQTPTKLEILRFGPGYALVLSKDDLDRESVHRYPLIRE